MTLYDELGLSPDCTSDDIKHRYRVLAMEHHPDKGGDVEKFKRIKFAYEVLIDPVRRKQYDKDKTTAEIPDIRVEANTFLANIFFSLIQHFNCKEGNLIEVLRLEIQNLKNRALEDSRMCDIYISNLEVVKNKLHIKDSQVDDILLSLVNQQLNLRYKDKEFLNHRLELADVMESILNNYDYGFLEIVESAESKGFEPSLPE